MTWNLGSVGTKVLERVENVPTYLSGTPLWEMAYESIVDMEQYTGQSIGSTGINQKYHKAILNFTISEVTSLMDVQGADASNIKLGEFSIKKGGDSNLSKQSKHSLMIAEKALKNLGRGTRSYQTFS